jgi:hypothetical protein
MAFRDELSIISGPNLFIDSRLPPTAYPEFWFQPNMVVDRIAKPLFTSKVTFSRLNRDVAK